MAYEKTTWSNGDTITAEKLNNIENGIASGVLAVGIYVNSSDSTLTLTLDKTWNEIYTVISNGGICVAGEYYDGAVSCSLVNSAHIDDGIGGSTLYVIEVGEQTYVNNSIDGYPVSYGY